MGRLSSWNCHGCTNVCYRLVPGEGVFEYCRPVMETGTHRTEWVTDDHIECLDKTNDPGATDNEVKLYHWPFGDRPVRSSRNK